MSEGGFKVVATVKEIQGGGHCALGFKEGQSWSFEDANIPENFCAWAFQAIFPFVSALRFGGEFPWEQDRDSALACCPDPNNPVVFSIKRIHKPRHE